MFENEALAQAEAIALSAKRDEINRLVEECEESDDRTLRSLVALYRRLNFNPY